MQNVWEVLVLVGLIIILALLILPFFATVHSGARISCDSNLSQIAKACITYQEPNGDFFPALWDGNRYDPMKSLAMLYPDYLDNPRPFACPQTKDRPEIAVTVLGEKVKRSSFGPVDTDKKCSYFYDELTNFRKIGPAQAIACDADGQTWVDEKGKRPSYPANWTRKPRKPNHEPGQNVMYFDGHVKWTESVYCSTDSSDNIFCPNGTDAGPWDPDTDAYLWDGVNARPIEIVK